MKYVLDFTKYIDPICRPDKILIIINRPPALFNLGCLRTTKIFDKYIFHSPIVSSLTVGRACVSVGYRLAVQLTMATSALLPVTNWKASMNRGDTTAAAN